jgi:chromosome segregation ATPase
MPVENIMYFALGLLVAGLIALIVMPAVWRRAVRLTKKRIEAATPITLAEFRADKDQLRAEFALSTRRLEMNVEALRARLAEQIRDIGKSRNDVSAIKSERDQHLTVIRELEEREAELRNRILDLEKEGTDLAQRLRMRDREFEDKVAELEGIKEVVDGRGQVSLDGRSLSGKYDEDIKELLTALALEKKRAEFLENQSRTLLAQLESSNSRTSEIEANAAALRQTLASKEDAAQSASNELIAAEARIADAENRLNTLLSETAETVEEGEQRTEQLLAEKLSLEDELRSLRGNVLDVESAVLADWDTERIDQAHMRERLNDIAAEVSKLVYALDGNAPDSEESLFDRVQKFAGDGLKVEDFTVRPGVPAKPPVGKGGAVSERLAALRDMQRRP